MAIEHEIRFPGESAFYRKRRFELLAAEAELRENLEKVAAMRRELPLGGPLPKDYVFEEIPGPLGEENLVKAVRFPELFENGKSSLVVYSFMFAPDAATPCPMCTSLLDSLNGAARHARERINLAVVAKAPIAQIRDWAAQRDWNHLRLLSSFGNTYNQDYFGESAKGQQFPGLNVFEKNDQGIFHFYHSELFFVPPETDVHRRHMDLIWPLWNLLDMTPTGRGKDWLPQNQYP